MLSLSELEHAYWTDKIFRFLTLWNPTELNVPDVTGLCNLTQIIQSIQKHINIWAITLKFWVFAECIVGYDI